MAKLKVEFVEGWTGPLDFQLLNDGAVQDLSTMTVTGQARNRLNALVDLSSDVSVVSATDGKVRITPDAADFESESSPYELRFKVVDVATAVVFFPSGEAVTLIVRP
jgi:hypothetical protein